jgi:hypothetical protein
VAFYPEGKIEKMAVAAVDLHPLAAAIRAAAQSATAHAR